MYSSIDSYDNVIEDYINIYRRNKNQSYTLYPIPIMESLGLCFGDGVPQKEQLSLSLSSRENYRECLNDRISNVYKIYKCKE